ncbi:MAG: hypothetical protein IJQ42_10905 [Oscillospiraceae bacterium]|nr:hypothetical protein [Oscillospiraceae bacterium]
MDARQTVSDFLHGKMDILTFRKHYDKEPEINAFLQGIVDQIKASGGSFQKYPFPYPGKPGEIFYSDEGLSYLLAPETDPSLAYDCPPKYESVRQLLTYEFRLMTHNVRTAHGALKFYDEVLVLFYQVDPTVPHLPQYTEAFDFALEVIPEYLSGGEAEMYIQEHILPLFPDTMKKTERKKAIRSRIKEEFRSEKGYPCWPQHSEWPLGKDGKPATYIGKGKSEGDLRRFRFRDESTGEIIVVEQAY